MSVIHYKAGYKYQLTSDCQFLLGPEFAQFSISTRYFSLSKRVLSLRAGYAWDGPSGWTFDTKTFMPGSAAHDALYQAMRMGFIPQRYRDPADRELRRICLQDGMWKVRAWWVYHGVRIGGEKSADPDNRRPILVAGI